MLLSSSLAQARNWSEYTSKNFILQTDASGKKTRPILSNFETFHTVVLFVAGVKVPTVLEPVVIVMYDLKRDFEALGLNGSIAGYYHMTEEGPRMVVGPSNWGMRRSQQTILFHEYVHYLMFNYSDFDNPRWFSEGLAELLSGTRIEKDLITLGVTPGYRGNMLKVKGKLDLAELLAPIDGTKAALWSGQFYATTWLLTHYLKISPLSGDAELISQSREYLRLYNKNGDSISAFEESFGEDLAVMDKWLIAYLREGGLTVLEMARPTAEVAISRRKLTTA